MIETVFSAESTGSEKSLSSISFPYTNHPEDLFIHAVMDKGSPEFVFIIHSELKSKRKT